MAKVYVSKPVVEILTPADMILRQLPIIETIARISHRSDKELSNLKTTEEFIRKWALKMEHASILEHGTLSFVITMNSRGLTHELVRHRVASFMQESTRYVRYAGGKIDSVDAECRYVIPPNKDPNRKVTLRNGWVLTIKQLYEINEMGYEALIKDGWNPGEARQYLAIGIMSKIAATVNFRALREIMEKRLAKPAHWEIRAAMVELYKQLNEIAPIIVCDFVEKGKDKYGIPYYERIKLK